MIVVRVLMLVSVAFYIVTERKGLGILQLRQGPNKVGFKGLFQPVADGIKLFTKEIVFPFSANKVLYVLGPMVCFICRYFLWVLFPSEWSCLSLSLGFLFFLCVSSFRVYGVFMVGLSCDSRYGFLGAIRAIAQRVSYEVFIKEVRCFLKPITITYCIPCNYNIFSFFAI